jgi:PAS domain S-box-containing protein
MRTSTQIQAEIEGCFGFFPPFFEPALPNPDVLEGLWQQTLSAYVQNPLPTLLKEKLLAYLSRYCSVPYGIVCHSCALFASGMSATEVLELLMRPSPSGEEDLEEDLATLAGEVASGNSWPGGRSPLDECLLRVSVFAFENQADLDRHRALLRRALGPRHYNHWAAFLAYVKTFHAWVEAHPDISAAGDRRVKEYLAPMMAKEPRLEGFFRGYGEHVRQERQVHHEVRYEQSKQELAQKVQERTMEPARANADLLGDLAERQRVEERIKRSEGQLVEAQAIAHIGSWDWDIPSDNIAWTDELYRIFGLDRDSFHASYQGFLDRLHPEDRARVDLIIQNAYQNHQPFEFEHRIVRPSGEVRSLYARGRVMVDGGGQAIRMSGTGQDITDRKEIEARLLMADRMASVGTLAAGVAHEINNPLSYIIGNLDLALRDLPTVVENLVQTELRVIERFGPSARQLWTEGGLVESSKRIKQTLEALDDALLGAERVRNIVRDMRTFSQVDDDQRHLVHLENLIESAISMAGNEIRYRARLVKEFGEAPPVMGNESRLTQVVLNLLTNAAHAIPEGSADKNEIRVRIFTDDAGRAVIAVKDTGTGMSPDTFRRIFDPFFTTKPVGTGTGLGLSVCHGIVSALGGEIDCDTELGKGSVFRVKLPPARLDKLAPGPQRQAKSNARRGRILLVDDEPKVAVSLARLLSFEHEVEIVTSGKAALARLREGSPYDLILCDLMMPEMTGMQLYQEIHRTWPLWAEQMVFITGGAFTSSAREFLARIPNVRLEKPVDSEVLRLVIRDRLG